MKTVSKSRLKSEMLGIFRDLEKNGGELVVTDRGIPVLKIIPFRGGKRSADEIFASHRGKVRYSGDIMEPLTDSWNSIPDDLPR